MLSLLTVNVGAAALSRAEAILEWLATRHEDVFLLTETSSGPGSEYLMSRFEAAGYQVRHSPDHGKDRGAAVVSKVPLQDGPASFEVSLPGRAVLVRLRTVPETAVLCIYVPSRDRSLDKTERKSGFIASLLRAVETMPTQLRERLILGGDYNVIGRDHHPRHAGFLDFEYGLLDGLERLDLTDAHEPMTPDQQQYSWVGRTGDGYRYDYFHVAEKLVPRLGACHYLQETRTSRLTDHAAVTLELAVEPVTRLPTRDPRMAAEPLALF